MAFEQEIRMEQIQKELNKQFPDCDYRNGIVAHFITEGKAHRLTEDWLRNALLRDAFEDEFITYERAVRIQKDYMRAIKMYSC